MQLKFGGFRFDSESRELLHGETPVHLTPKAYAFLELLLTNRPRALSKQKIQNAVWPDAFVEESSIASLAAEVRAALGDDARDPLYLRTVYGFGYAFCAEVTVAGVPLPEQNSFVAAGAHRSLSESRPSMWCLIWKGTEVPLVEGENIVGRDVDAAIWVGSTTASRHHARIMVSGSSVVLEDLSSKNGTCLNGRPVNDAVALQEGDEIQVAQAVMVLRFVDSKSSTVTRLDR